MVVPVTVDCAALGGARFDLPAADGWQPGAPVAREDGCLIPYSHPTGRDFEVPPAVYVRTLRVPLPTSLESGFSLGSVACDPATPGPSGVHVGTAFDAGAYVAGYQRPAGAWHLVQIYLPDGLIRVELFALPEPLRDDALALIRATFKPAP